ncbi:MAG: ABC transporter ATP-binding protein [Acholeplasmataceae bacterium]
MKMILKLLKPHKIRLTIALTLKSLAAMADLMIPFLIAYMIDDQIPTLSGSYIPLFYTGAIMVGIAVLGWIMNVTANRFSEYIAAEAAKTLRHDLFSSTMYLSSHQVDHLSKPSLISRMTTDTYNLYRATAIIQRLGIRAPVLLIGGIMLSFTLDPVLTLVMLVMFPFITAVVYFGSKRGVPLYHKTQKLMDQLIRKLREFITGARVIRALSMNHHEIKQFKQMNQDANDAELFASKVMASINPLMTIMMNIGLVIVLIIGAYRLNNQMTEIGSIMAFVTYFTIILNAMMGITRIFVLSSRASASSERIQEVLDENEELVAGDSEIDPNHDIHVQFSHVFFSYFGHTDQLKDVSFTLKKGQSLGIIGATGSGKSTIANILMRFYDVDEGHINVFGKDIKTMNKKELRKHIGFVMQNDMIFHDTIKYNVNLTHEGDIDYKAIQTAQATFVFDREKSVEDMLTTGGTNVSGGQKQRILISRALASNPSILILDDASSALDYETDQKLREALNINYSDVTKIIIAQRVASLKSCDHIIMIDQGQVIASGTHDTLMKTSKDYLAIATHQLGVIS